MADFCRQCSIEDFNEDSKDLSNLIDAEEVVKGYVMPVLCEGCGPTNVDHTGKCLTDCLKHHNSK